jgi:tetratricopeptide (TPR) repeat protein
MRLLESDGAVTSNGTSLQDRARWESVITDLIAEADSVEPAARAECLRQVASTYEHKLGDLPRALVSWQAAFVEDPADYDAAMAVERLTDALGQWSLVLPDCDDLLTDMTEPAPRAAFLAWLARWHERFAHDEVTAERYLLEAAELAPASVAVAETLSALYRKHGDWARAAAVCKRAGLATDDLEQAVGLLLEAARLLHDRVGDAAAGMQLYRRVLELDPRNATAAEALAEAAGTDLEPAAICARYRQALDVDPGNLGIVRQWAEVAFSHGRLDDLRAMFELLFERVGVPAGARHDTRARLNEALDRFVAAEKWPEAIDVLRTLARESTGVLAAKYFAAAGKIADHELKDRAAAIELYDRALDADPDDSRLFDRLIGMLSDSRSWQQAEQALRRMIARQRAAGQGENADVMIPLWRKLGDVYRTGIRDLASAAEAYGECARLAPKDRYAKMVAEMTARSPVLAALQAR